MSRKVIPIRTHGARPHREHVDARTHPGGALGDLRGRPLRDLRISVTDRCNFRCVYCMPREVFDASYRFLPHSAILSFEEIARLARIFVELGVKKIRLTGGEPLVRKDVHKLIAMLSRLDVDLTLTTNGALLARQARALKNAGLRRITVSLDSLDEETFRAMSDADVPVRRVLDGIESAAAAGLSPVKINMVVKRGTNDHQILDAVRHWRGTGHVLRFIEYMDVGSTNGWRMDDVVPSAEVLRRIGAVFPVEPIDPSHPGEVAERWRYSDGAGEIGVISSVTQAFCRDCNRMRLSTEGKLFTCLFAEHGHDLMPLVRGGVSDDVLRDAITGTWMMRDDRYSELRTNNTARLRKVEMSYIGG